MSHNCHTDTREDVCTGSLRLAAVAEIENGKQTGAAMGTDDHPEGRDIDFSHIRMGFSHLGTDKIGIGKAVGMENEHLFAGCVHQAQIVQNSLEDGFESFLPATGLHSHIQRALIRHIEDGLDIQQRTHQSRRVGNSSATLEIVEVVHGEATSRPRPPEMHRVSIT